MWWNDVLMVEWVHVRLLQFRVLHGESNYWDTDTHMWKLRNQVAFRLVVFINTVPVFPVCLWRLIGWRTDIYAHIQTKPPQHTQTHSGRCCQMDSGQGQWSCWVIFHFSFTVSCPLSTLFVSIFSQSLPLPPCCGELCQPPQVTFTFKCLNFAPWSIPTFPHSLIFFTLSLARTWLPTQLLHPNESWLSFWCHWIRHSESQPPWRKWSLWSSLEGWHSILIMLKFNWIFLYTGMPHRSQKDLKDFLT